jgi:hypothetical protein
MAGPWRHGPPRAAARRSGWGTSRPGRLPSTGSPTPIPSRGRPHHDRATNTSLVTGTNGPDGPGGGEDDIEARGGDAVALAGGGDDDESGSLYLEAIALSDLTAAMLEFG